MTGYINKSGKNKITMSLMVKQTTFTKLQQNIEKKLKD